MFHNITVYCFFDQINTTLQSIRDFLREIFFYEFCIYEFNEAYFLGSFGDD